MNVKETAGVLALFTAAFPAATIQEQTPQVWASMLIGVHAEDGREAADRIIRESEFFPSVAKFLEACKPLSAARVRTDQAAKYEELNAGPVYGNPQENIRRLQKSMRELVDARQGQQHKHFPGGPPCPVCGGVA